MNIHRSRASRSHRRASFCELDRLLLEILSLSDASQQAKVAASSSGNCAPRRHDAACLVPSFALPDATAASIAPICVATAERLTDQSSLESSCQVYRSQTEITVHF